MEYHVKLSMPLADLQAVEDALRAIDPAAQVDIDPLQQHLRVAAHLEGAELAGVLGQAGVPVLPHHIVQLPSICCGGCGG